MVKGSLVGLSVLGLAIFEPYNVKLSAEFYSNFGDSKYVVNRTYPNSFASCVKNIPVGIESKLDGFDTVGVESTHSILDGYIDVKDIERCLSGYDRNKEIEPKLFRMISPRVDVNKNPSQVYTNE